MPVWTDLAMENVPRDAESVVLRLTLTSLAVPGSVWQIGPTTVSAPIQQVDSVEESISHRPSRAVEATLLRRSIDKFSAGVSIESGKHRLELRIRRLSLPSLGPGYSCGLRWELVCDGRCAAKGMFSEYEGDEARASILIEDEGYIVPRDAESTSHWSIRIVGDPAVALLDFDCEAYWAGDFIIPLSSVLRPEVHEVDGPLPRDGAER
jgi:hypothetical protein